MGEPAYSLTMVFVFRFDASEVIGAGHAMRSAAIAEEVRRLGFICIFVCETEPPTWICDFLLNLGQIMTEEEFDKRKLKFEKCILVVDSYSINPSHYFLDKKRWSKIISIVDHVTPNYLADLYIHPGLDVSWYRGTSYNLLFGTRYIPFRSSITQKPYEPNDQLKLITVFGGGVDSFGFAESVCTILEKFGIKNQVCVFTSRPKNFQDFSLDIQIENFGQALDTRMLTTGLVFTTASTSSLETAARGIPMGVACSVSNQSILYKSLQKNGVALGIGEIGTNGKWVFELDSIAALVSNETVRAKLAHNCKDFIDLLGSKRIVDTILTNH